MEDILLSHSSKHHSYKHALALQKLGRLAKFITSIYYDPTRFPDKVFSSLGKIHHILKKRHEPSLSDKVIRFPFFEIPEQLLRRLIGNRKTYLSTVCARDFLFDAFVSKTQIHNCKIFWGFQGSCLKSLKVAKRKNIITILDFPSVHINFIKNILKEEQKRNPDWKDFLNNFDFPPWYVKRLKEEPFVADYCVVASEFSKKTLQDEGFKPANIFKLSLGVDLNKFKFKERRQNSLFKIIFVGAVSQGKGIKYLLDAVKKLDTKKIKLRIAGPIIGNKKRLKEYSDFCEYLGVLSQEELIIHMHKSDCLVLPSLFEGFGLVILEAMATGMPVIASTYSAAPEIIRDKIDGFVIEPRNVDGLSEKINWMAGNKERVIEMGANAFERAKEFSWERHSERLKQILKNIDIIHG